MYKAMWAGKQKLYKPIIIYFVFLLMTAIFMTTIAVDFIFQLNGMTPLVVNPPDGRSPFIYLICMSLSFLMFSIMSYMIFKEKAYQINIFVPMNHCKMTEYKNTFHLVYNGNSFQFNNEKMKKKIKELKMLKFTADYNIFGKYIGTYINVRSQL
jgi:hypothetical protein